MKPITRKPVPQLRTVLTILMVIAGGAALAAGLLDAGPVDARYRHSDMVLLVIYVSLALVFSFLCSIAEAVLLSITPSYIAGLQEKRPRRAALLKQLKIDNVDRSLAAILTLNTIAHTVGAIGSGSKATAVFGSAWFGVFSAVMTLLILFLSEIIPKTLGAVHWRRLATPTASFVRGLIFLLYPLIVVSEKLTRLVAHGKDVHVFSRDEFIAMAGIGERSGDLRERESRIIRNLFRFEALRVRDVMTPRTVIVALPRALDVNQALAKIQHSPFSRLPLYDHDLDDIKGFVLKNDLLLAKAQGRGDTAIDGLRREVLTVSAQTPLSDLLETLLQRRQHIAIVAGDYGGTKGLVTLEDAVETLLGMEIVDEMDKVEDMQALARQQWEKRALALGVATAEDSDTREQQSADQQGKSNNRPAQESPREE